MKSVFVIRGWMWDKSKTVAVKSNERAAVELVRKLRRILPDQVSSEWNGFGYREYRVDEDDKEIVRRVETGTWEARR